MGMEFNNLTDEDLCDLMCGLPEIDGYCMAGHEMECDGNCEGCEYFDRED